MTSNAQARLLEQATHREIKARLKIKIVPRSHLHDLSTIAIRARLVDDVNTMGACLGTVSLRNANYARAC